MGSRSGSTDCRIYVGNLPPDIKVKELDDLFYKYGNIRHIDLKNRRGSPYAFIDFEDYRLVEFKTMHISSKNIDIRICIYRTKATM